MKKVLFVATVVLNHIMEFHIPYLKMLKEMGWETSVAARNDYENPEDCRIPYCDHYYDIPFERKPWGTDNKKAYEQLKQLIDENHYDIIHCHTPVGAVLARMAARDARKHGTKVIYTAHGFHFFDGAPVQNWLLYYPVEKALSRDTDVLITINTEDYQRAKEKFYAGRTVYVPGVGIDLNKFSSPAKTKQELRKELHIPEDAFVFLSVGELNTNKNHIAVINALQMLGNEKFIYVVCGRGEREEELKQYIQKNHLEGNVILPGYCSNISDYYHMADAFVFPSFREGLSLSLMEAMACRLPVLCSDIRGNKDLIENPESRFNPHDIHEIVRKMSMLAQSDNTGEINRNYAHLSEYELNHVLSLVKDIYLEEVNEKG